MLEYELDGNILIVTEKILSFTDTQIKTVKYDIKNWTKQVNNDPVMKCTQSDIDWVKKYYFPKVGLK